MTHLKHPSPACLLACLPASLLGNSRVRKEITRERHAVGTIPPDFRARNPEEAPREVHGQAFLEAALPRVCIYVQRKRTRARVYAT